MKITVFGPDANDSNLVRRICTMEKLGHEVVGFTLRRDEDKPRPWNNIDLGRTYDAQYLQRISSIWRSIRQVRDHPLLQETDLFWARNLEMLAVAVSVRHHMGTALPIVYETLDIHRLLTKSGPAHGILRWIEGRLMKKVDAISISSPAFQREYYDKTHPDHPPITLIENRLPSDTLPQRPGKSAPSGPLRLGWAGMLRCRRSFHTLCAIAREAEGRIEIVMHGLPAYDQIPDFDEGVRTTPHVTYLGPYRFPQGLSDVYSTMDVVWSGDYFQSGGGPVAVGNSSWALANRLYEGGYFGVPALVPEGTEMANWVRETGTGRIVQEPIEETLLPILLELQKGALAALQSAISKTPDETFVDDGAVLKQLLAELVPEDSRHPDVIKVSSNAPSQDGTYRAGLTG